MNLMSTELEKPRDAFDWVGGTGQPETDVAVAGPCLSDYPELEPVISSAMDSVVASFYPETFGADVLAYLDRVTVAATVAIYAPIAAIAARAGQGARRFRTTRSAEADRAAEHLATGVDETAEALHTRGEEIAVTVADNASVAAKLVAASPAARANEKEAAETAAAMEVVVDDAAEVIVVEQTQAASLVEQSATAAASGVAAAAEADTATSSSKLTEAAAALRTVALQTCYQVAFNVGASAAEAVLADGMPD